MDYTKVLEDAVLQAVDAVAEQSPNRVTKILVDMFKSAILKKYKDVFDEELPLGKVHKEIVNKAVDYCFAEACVSFRLLPDYSDEVKEREIRAAKPMLDSVKQTVLDILMCRNVVIIQ